MTKTINLSDIQNNDTCMSISIVLIYMLMNKKLNVSNATSFIRDSISLIDKTSPDYEKLTATERKKIIVEMIENIAKGPDGILGTNDDLIPKETIEQLTYFLKDKTVIEDIIDLCLMKNKKSVSFFIRLVTCSYKSCAF